jgi:hypothetical protein
VTRAATAPARIHSGPGGPWIDLLVAVFRDSPRLPRALCRGEPDVWDVANAAKVDVANAIRICQHCPELPACERYAAGRRDLVGVWAGTYHRVRNDRDETSSETEKDDDE